MANYDSFISYSSQNNFSNLCFEILLAMQTCVNIVKVTVGRERNNTHSDFHLAEHFASKYHTDLILLWQSVAFVQYRYLLVFRHIRAYHSVNLQSLSSTHSHNF